MYNERRKGLTYSALLHLLWLLFAIFGLPSLLTRDRIDEPMVITVELLPITGVTNVKPSEKTPEPTEKPEEKKPEEEKKPTPPVKTAEEPPPPPPAEKPVEKPVEKKKEEEKKPEEKKKEKKKKPKEDDLAAVLKAVRETAKKDKKDAADKGDDKKKNNSSSYNPELPLSLSEKDAIRSQIAKCWNVPAGAKDAYELIVVLVLEVAQDGSVLKVELANESKARYSRDTFYRAAADSAMRAVRQCSPLKNLPPEKYETWRSMELTFDPKEMLF